MKRYQQSDRPEITEPTRGEYNGNPTLSLPTDDPRYPFSFGLKKAKAILANLEAVRSFVADLEKQSA